MNNSILHTVVETLTGDYYIKGSMAILTERSDFLKIKRVWDYIPSYIEKLLFWQQLDFLKCEYEFKDLYYPRYITFEENYQKQGFYHFDYSKLLTIEPKTNVEKKQYFDWILKLPETEIIGHSILRMFINNKTNIEAYLAISKSGFSAFIESYFAENSRVSTSQLYQFKEILNFYKSNDRLDVSKIEGLYVSEEADNEIDYRKQFKLDCKEEFKIRVDDYFSDLLDIASQRTLIEEELEYLKSPARDEDEFYPFYQIVYETFEKNRSSYDFEHLLLLIKQKIASFQESISTNEELERLRCLRHKSYIMHLLTIRQVQADFRNFLLDQLAKLDLKEEKSNSQSIDVAPSEAIQTKSSEGNSDYIEGVFLKDIVKDRYLHLLEPILKILSEEKIDFRSLTETPWRNRSYGYKNEVANLGVYLKSKNIFDEKKLKLDGRKTIVSVLRNQFDSDLKYDTWIKANQSVDKKLEKLLGEVIKLDGK